MTWQRIDVRMVEQGLVATRSQAARLVADQHVSVDGVTVDKAARKVPPDARVHVDEPDLVGRGGLKLRGALEHFGVSVAGSRCVDVGASTGGFTQALLLAGAKLVVAIDVGHGQLDPRLEADERVESHEGLNARHIEAGSLGDPFDVVVADLSFISLRLVADSLVSLATASADLVLLVKPQFEVGRDHVGRTGVVTDPHLHVLAVDGVCQAFSDLGWSVRDTVESPVVGGDGNREFFIWLRKAP